jgi:hypothetical protein
LRRGRRNCRSSAGGRSKTEGRGEKDEDEEEKRGKKDSQTGLTGDCRLAINWGGGEWPGAEGEK